MSNAKLKQLYKLDAAHEWMNIISDMDSHKSSFDVYKSQKNRLIRLMKYIDLKDSDRVADFGCGNGLLLDIIADKIGFYDGIDSSEDFIPLAQKRQQENKIFNANFYCANILKFCNDNIGVYDKAFAMDFSEHISDDDFIAIFEGIKRTLKDGGKLYIHTPNSDYLLEILKKRGIMKQFKEHVGIRNDKRYLYLLNKIGYTSIRITYLPHYLGYLSFFDFLSYIPFWGKYFKARLFIECTK